VPRKSRDQLFRKSDFWRVVDSARAKGLRVTGAELTRDGVKITFGDSETGKADEATNEVENWISQHEHQG
jgi:hypothetical protein